MEYKENSALNFANNLVHYVPFAADQVTLERLFTSCIPQLRRTARRILHNPQDSDDALQDALLSAVRNLSQFRGSAKFSTWLRRIVINAALMRLRTQKPTVSIDEQVPSEDSERFSTPLVDPRPNPEEEYATQERTRILAAMLENLPTSHRTIVWLVDVEGMSGKEAAQKLGITMSALKARHHRARRSMVRKMTEERSRAGPASHPVGAPG